jgi:hypothetical protein
MGFGYVFIKISNNNIFNVFNKGAMMYKSILNVAVALVVVVCLGLGCAGSIPPPAYFESMEKTAGEGESEIVFKRPWRYSLSLVNMKIYIDDEERLRLGNAKTETVVVPDGTHKIYGCDARARAGTGSKRAIMVNAAGNRTVLIARWKGADGILWGGVELSKHAEIPLNGSTVAQTSPSAEPAVEPLAETRAPTTGNAASGMEEVIKRATSKLMNDLPRGSKIAVVDVSTDDWEIASTVIDEIEYNFVSSKRYTIVDRKTLDVIRNEQKLQTSGAISDETIVKIGALSGANVVIAGSLTKSGGSNRLSLRALDVQTGQIITMARESY